MKDTQARILSKLALFNDIQSLPEGDRNMVEGVIGMLLQIKDVDNRMEIAHGLVEQYREEGIVFNYDEFIERVM